MKELLKEWLQVKAQIDHYKKLKLDLEKKIYIAGKEKFDKKDEGTITVNCDELCLTVKKSYSVSVNQEQAKMIPFGFRTKFELDKKAYKELSDEEK